MLDRANSRRLRSFLPPLLLQLKLPLLLLIMFFFHLIFILQEPNENVGVCDRKVKHDPAGYPCHSPFCL